MDTVLLSTNNKTVYTTWHPGEPFVNKIKIFVHYIQDY
jgi:sulfatase maturation enzyme AslB (radical SAM superfamily)